ncbi:MAG: 3-oxoacyl-ACP reductase FabG [Candidatus Nanopelagicales bacterium]
MERLNGKVALVTGGAAGIGRQICLRFAAEGAIVYAADINPGEFPEEGVRPLVMNVTDAESIAAAVATITEQEGRIDILVNNAGITRDGLIEKIDDDMWNIVIDVDLKGVFNVTKAVAPVMVAAGEGSIINISSIVGIYGNIGQSNYAASKAGVIGMTYTWAKEFTRKGAHVRTNAIAPGYINTDMMKTVPEKVLERLRAANPLGRLGEPTEIAAAALFLASDESSYVNGHVLSVDGGVRI